ncbi:PLD nuclease N-terminal domain-containing protein [Oceanobacillus sp. Castelsardo]|uniref:PLD nuclease N-terminal domain-containing protein n=1 Tax=Oceanobacillus sp. Castelsardo TaxID=1851204 RepID=UPI000838BCA5|nr:PLD nuclease N-terminal domain-containing protein [Oceanobacillus sp. Castelsardo]
MQTFTELNWALIAPLIGLQLILMIFALVNWAKQDETNGPKWMWIPIIVFVSMIGPVAYFIFGRKNV